MIAHFSFKNHHLNDSSFLTLHPSLQQLSHRLSAFVLLSFCKFCMLLGATLLYGGHYLESAVAADFLQCPDGSAALVHQYSPPLPQLPAARLLSLSFPPSARCFPWLADWH